MVNVTIYSIHGSYGMWNTPQSNSCLLDLFMYEHVQGALCWSSSFLDGWNIIQFLEYPIMNSHEIHGFFSFFTTFPMKNMEFPHGIPMELPWNSPNLIRVPRLEATEPRCGASTTIWMLKNVKILVPMAPRQFEFSGAPYVNYPLVN